MWDLRFPHVGKYADVELLTESTSYGCRGRYSVSKKRSSSILRPRDIARQTTDLDIGICHTRARGYAIKIVRMLSDAIG